MLLLIIAKSNITLFCYIDKYDFINVNVLFVRYCAQTVHICFGLTFPSLCGELLPGDVDLVYLRLLLAQLLMPGPWFAYLQCKQLEQKGNQLLDLVVLAVWWYHDSYDFDPHITLQNNPAACQNCLPMLQ